MKRAVLLSFLLIATSLQHSAQSVDSIVKLQLKIKHLKGLYNSKEKSFYSKNIDSLFNEHVYSSQKFYGNIGILKYSYVSKKNRDYSVFERLGIIDTTGNIIVPCVYDELSIPMHGFESLQDDKKKYSTVYNFSYFVFKNKDSVGIVKPGNKIILEIPKETKVNGKSTWNHVHQFADTVQNDIDYCRILFNGICGLFSVNAEKIIVPAKFDEITICNDFAICRKENDYTVYNCLNGNSSTTFRLARYLKNGSFLVKDKNNKMLVCNNIFAPETSINKTLTQDSIVEYFNRHIILMANGKYGVVDETENIVVPLMYNNIFFLDLKYFMVEQNGLWAISNAKHELLSAFEFIDVEKQNAVNFKNFLHFNNSDTIGNSKIILLTLSTEGITYESEEFLQRSTRRLILELNSHLLSDYSDFNTERYALKKKDGFHLITFFRHENKIQLDSMWWDNIYQLPGRNTIGVQRAEKFGYYVKEQKLKKYLKYDDIRFIAGCEREWQKSLPFRNGARFYSTSPFTVIKNGTIYYHQSSFIPWERFDERNRWKKWGKIKK